jgi:hypothetical protein
LFVLEWCYGTDIISDKLVMLAKATLALQCLIKSIEVVVLL